MGCCASLLKCCVRAETENPLLDSGHSGGAAGNGQQVRHTTYNPRRDANRRNATFLFDVYS